jgi:hypothetical protein
VIDEQRRAHLYRDAAEGGEQARDHG